MPKKKEPTNEENVIALYREFLKIVDPKDLKIAEDLQGDDLRDFRLYCHETFNNRFFEKIVKGFIFDQCMMTAQAGITAEQYMNGKMIVAGIIHFKEYFARQAAEYEKMMAKDQEFDPQKSFEPAKV